ncbi:MAG: threonylcarbamoyl-AMP synthase [Deltaproteobacteria bacterium]|nr:threonylcarbamoyl-AMP synthase [Deltaproteobacteria bacterium]
MTQMLRINPRDPEPALIQEIVTNLQAGQVVAYPTETFYGLGVHVANERAIKRLFELKRRDVTLPIAILVADLPMLSRYVIRIPAAARGLMRAFWPGPLTVLFPAGAAISKALTTNTGKIGIRISSHPVATAILSRLGRPITTTSANLSGFPASCNVKHVQKYFGDRLDLIVDGGECPPSLGSTVVDVADETMAIVRDGALAADAVIKCFQGGDGARTGGP